MGNTNLLIEALSEMHGHYPRLDYGSQLAKELLYKHRVEEARQVFVSFIHGTDGNLYQSIYRNHLLPYSEVLNKSTGTIQKSHPKILRYSNLFAVLLKLIQKFGLWYFYSSPL